MEQRRVSQTLNSRRLSVLQVALIIYPQQRGNCVQSQSWYMWQMCCRVGVQCVWRAFVQFTAFAFNDWHLQLGIGSSLVEVELNFPHKSLPKKEQNPPQSFPFQLCWTNKHVIICNFINIILWSDVEILKWEKCITLGWCHYTVVVERFAKEEPPQLEEGILVHAGAVKTWSNPGRSFRLDLNDHLGNIWNGFENCKFFLFFHKCEIECRKMVLFLTATHQLLWLIKR